MFMQIPIFEVLVMSLWSKSRFTPTLDFSKIDLVDKKSDQLELDRKELDRPEPDRLEPDGLVLDGPELDRLVPDRPELDRPEPDRATDWTGPE